MLMPSRLRLPDVPRPSTVNQGDPDSGWDPFPEQASIPIFDLENSHSPEEYSQGVRECRPALDGWLQKLPTEISNLYQPSSQSICLQLVFHCIYIGLFVRARRYGYDDNRPADRAFLHECLKAKVASARAIAQLCNRHRELYGMHGKPFMITQASCMSILVLLEDLQDPQSAQALIDMCVILRAICASMYVAKGFLRMVKPTAHSLGVTLPPETQELLDDFEKVEWDNADFHRFSSGFPNYALEENFVSDDSFQMEDLLKKFEAQARLRLWE
ncbi:MAG: hypothetical protein Q9227_000311 [Pyrenula ochraceoflavens]